MSGVLVVGFFLGMTHATEADHIAAVATLATRAGSARTAVKTGVLWGLGHMTTLLLVGGIALGVGTAIPHRLAALLETGVGVMLLLLGLDVLRRSRKAPTPPEVKPVAPGTGPADAPRWRPFVVGLVHGMAGSAALVVLAAGSAHSPLTGLGYMLLFSAGSVLGMALVSLAMVVPLHFTARHLPRAATLLRIGTGILSIVVGVIVLVESLPGIA